jgi:hypothetical protein
VFPLEETEGGGIAVGCAVVPDRDGILELEAVLGAPLEFRLARRGEVALALGQGYARLAPGAPDDPGPRIGIRPFAHRPIGELLIDIGAISYLDLIKALPNAAGNGKRLGEYLLTEGRIVEAQITQVIALQLAGEPQPSDPVTAAVDAIPYVLDRNLAPHGGIAPAG